MIQFLPIIQKYILVLLRTKYDGYLFGNKEVYNPWSMLNYIDEARKDLVSEPVSYWVNTSGNEIIYDFLKRSDSELKDNFTKLVNGEAIKADIYPEMTYRELEDDEMVYSYLLTTGYLKALGKNEDGTYNLVIPNKEVRTVYEKYFSKYTKGLKKKYSLKICRSLFDGDGEKAEELINDLRNGTITKRLNLSDEDRKYYESQMEAFPKRANFLEELLKKGKDQFIPKNYWPYVMLTKFWLGGSVGPNSETSRKYLDEKTIFFDVGYGASEGKFTIPTKPDTPEGILSIFGGFYEFKDLENGQILTADKVELNKEYELIITTYGGLYRYELHDIIEIIGFTGTTPNLIFKTKSGEILNISQEKIPAIEVVNKIKDGLNLSFKQVQIFENHDEKNYEIYIELEKETQINANELASKLNEILIESFELYELYNRMGLMTPLKVILMKNGWIESLYAMKSKGNVPKSQIKLPLIITEKPDKEYIL